MALSPIGGHCQCWLRGEWMEDEALLLMETENLRDPIKENLKIRTETGGEKKNLAKRQENVLTPEVRFTQTEQNWTACLTTDPRPVLLWTHAGICMTSQPWPVTLNQSLWQSGRSPFILIGGACPCCVRDGHGGRVKEEEEEEEEEVEV